MENFVFNIPTIAYVGKGQLSNLSSSIKQFGGSKVLLVYGGGSIKKNGIYNSVVNEMQSADIAYTELSGVKPNPRIEDAIKGIELYRQKGCDFILAVGGGSTIDAAKAIAAGVKYKGELIDLVNANALIQDAAPLASVLTMAGTGSELDPASVITVGDDHKKYLLVHPLLNPKFSIIDPEFTYSVPKKHVMAGCSDILSHLMEQYLRSEEDSEVLDGMSEGIMKAVIKNTLIIKDDPHNYVARANIAWASSMALAGFQFMGGKSFSAFPVHSLGHELSSFNDMTHGETLALITPSWIRFNLEKAPQYTTMFARFARNVFAVQESDDLKAAQKGVQKLEQWYMDIEMPKNLRAAGIPEEKLEYLATKATERGDIGTLTPINKEQALEIYKMAW